MKTLAALRARFLMRASAIVFATVLLTVNPGATPRALALDVDNVTVTLSQLSSGLAAPTAVVSARDGTGRLFITEQAGRVRVRIQGSGLRSTAYLDIRGRVNYDQNERGLLGIVFHPNFESNGYFYVSYTDSEGDLRVSRFHANPTSNTADSSSEKILIQIPHRSYANHNGGQLQFPIKYLYISTGDGGGAGGPGGYAQSKDSLLGKILRIEPKSGCSHTYYCIPTSNPYDGDTPGRGEIWHMGLRNPWRFSFDRDTYDQWIADVGQNDYEEVNRTGAGVNARNYGWDCYEGKHSTVSTYGGSYCSDGRTFTRPVWEYARTSPRCAVVGGYVYRGSDYDHVIEGMYFYGDYCSGQIWALNRRSDGTWDNALVRDHSGNITSFGEGASGEIYLTDAQGRLYKLTARNG